jgi:hypothetical protein
MADAPTFDGPMLDAPRDAGPPLGPHPTVDLLPERPELPDLFESFDGSRTARSVADWEGWRRDELRELISFYLYGYIPEDEVTVTATTLNTVEDFVAGAVRYEEIELTVAPIGLTLHVSLFSPIGVTAPPVFIALNRCGNQETTTDARVRATTAWFGENCGASLEATRGVRAYQWPIETITGAGYALAAIHESEIDPDDAENDFANGVHGLLTDEARDPRLRWGRIAAWAWGISRVVDWMETSDRVDGSRIAVVGHSRRGKTALLAGALDPRISMVIAHQSGRGGAALTRHLSGEPVAILNTTFPSWFDDVYPTFAGFPTRIPVDQHMLIALSAPRLVLCTDGDSDAWADPMGARMAVEAADAAWDLYGDPGIVLEGADPSLDGALAWHLRPGDHDLTAVDWEVFLDFAQRHWPAP